MIEPYTYTEKKKKPSQNQTEGKERTKKTHYDLIQKKKENTSLCKCF